MNEVIRDKKVCIGLLLKCVRGTAFRQDLYIIINYLKEGAP